ncbi:MAG: hypothetical protein AVDCRST_MAG79-3025, partial [uncultured Thermoleophilia bacterium]
DDRAGGSERRLGRRDRRRVGPRRPSRAARPRRGRRGAGGCGGTSTGHRARRRLPAGRHGDRRPTGGAAGGRPVRAADRGAGRAAGGARDRAQGTSAVALRRGPPARRGRRPRPAPPRRVA